MTNSGRKKKKMGNKVIKCSKGNETISRCPTEVVGKQMMAVGIQQASKHRGKKKKKKKKQKDTKDL
jgi:hypothetical protein